MNKSNNWCNTMVLFPKGLKLTDQGITDGTFIHPCSRHHLVLFCMVLIFYWVSGFWKVKRLGPLCPYTWEDHKSMVLSGATLMPMQDRWKYSPLPHGVAAVLHLHYTSDKKNASETVNHQDTEDSKLRQPTSTLGTPPPQPQNDSTKRLLEQKVWFN